MRDVITGFLLFAVGGWTYWQSAGFPRESRFFTLLVSCLMMFLGLLLFGQALSALLQSGGKRGSDSPGPAPKGRGEAYPGGILRVALLALLLAAYGFGALYYLGYYVATPLLMAGVGWVVRGRLTPAVVVVAVVTTALTGFFIGRLLNVPLPTGLLLG